MKPIVTRFAPSPSGYLHVGGARTALFNWLYARHTGGRFVLRIEDTDFERSSEASIDAILEALEWLGLDWDEGPFFQSKRLESYQNAVQKLLDSGHAYYCICRPEELEAKRRKAMATDGKAQYDGTCRDKGLPPTPQAVVRFKTPLSGTTLMEDAIKKNIRFNNTDVEDFVIQRSDGTPTYNLAVTVDDAAMGINTIIRGDDHVSNTPKQILLYKALGHELPTFGHVPMVLGKDRTRLSKRHGAMSVTAYRDMGYLPDAFINYLVRLGWSFGDQEFFTRGELIEKFTLENIGRSAGIFDTDKLLALNAEHIKTAPADTLARELLPFLTQAGHRAQTGPYLEKVIETLRPRSKTLVEMASGADFYFVDPLEYEEKAAQKFLKPANIGILQASLQTLEKVSEFTESHLEEALRTVMQDLNLKFGKIAQPLRVALTGRTVSPGIFEMLEALGQAEVLKRLQQAIAHIKTRG